MIIETGRDLIEFMERKFSSRGAEETHKEWQELKEKIVPNHKYNFDTSISGFQLRATIQNVYEYKMRQLEDICE